MVYECEQCEEQLHPGGLFCHRCGQKFDAPVPEDATPPVGQVGYVPAARRGKSPAARATIVLSHGPLRYPPRLPAPKPLVDSLIDTLARRLRSRGL